MQSQCSNSSLPPRFQNVSEILNCSVHKSDGLLTVPVGKLNVNFTRSKNNLAIVQLLKKLHPFVQHVKMDELKECLYSGLQEDGEFRVGALQMPRGSLLVVDECGLKEGKLGDVECKNVNALMEIAMNQKLPFDFSSHAIMIDANYPFLSLSEGKSLFPMDLHVPLANETFLQEVNDDVIEMCRNYLLSCHFIAFSIGDEMSLFLQHEFIRLKSAKQMKQEHFEVLLTLARCLAVCEGKEDLDNRIWNESLELFYKFQ